MESFFYLYELIKKIVMNLLYLKSLLKLTYKKHNQKMKEKIQAYLENLEKEKEIEILFACETGSRAWGFPSPDSDFDVRILYKHNRDWYLNLIEEKDSIESFYENGDIDISGWDIRKSLRLLWKSNPPLLERIQSPIVYKENKEFINELNLIAKTTYSPITTIHHYLSMAKKAYADIISSDQYKLKRFFYALRASIACVWLLKEEVMPPIEFGTMLNKLDIPLNIKNRIEELIKLKATISETYMHKGEQDILDFIKTCINQAEEEAKNLPSSNRDMRQLNNFFRKIVG